MEWKEYFESKKEVVQEVLTYITDGLYLGFWAVVQFEVDEWFLKPLVLHGVEEWTKELFRGIFAFSSLVPPILRLYKDVRVSFLRTQRSIDEAKNKKG